jgi:hypothetical protein
LIDKESLKINILEQILIEKAEQFFRLAPARTTHCGGEPAKAGNRLTAGLGGRRGPAGQDVFLLRGGLIRKVEDIARDAALLNAMGDDQLAEGRSWLNWLR